MTGVLAGYLRRRVGLQTIGLLVFLAGLMQVLELLDVTNDILDRDLGVRGIVYYAWLRSPSELVLSLPLAVLLGAMSSFYAMAKSQEVTAIRAAGVSLKRLLVLLLPVPILLGGVQFFLSQAVVPKTEARLKAWWDASSPPEDTPPKWVQTSDGPASFDHATLDGRRLDGLRLYLRGADGLFSTRVTARQAQWENGTWRLDDVRELRVSDAGTQRVEEASRSWRINLRPEDVVQLDVDQPHLSSIMLVDVIAGERVGAQPLTYYQTVLYRSFTAPVAAFIMLLLAIPPARMLTRGGGGGSLLIALGLGLAYLLVDGLMAAMGTSGRMPPLAAALAAPALFIAIGAVQLARCDRT
ncbi:MAG TPA: LptF/LptG family permease [Nevskiaceae bacterium]|nr:LptF/LptG family permease [Nevskiaceae bacterium]